MDASGNNKSNDSTEWKTPLALKVWFYEAEISESIYRFWCRITGHKFERRIKERQNSCLLVTKRGFHLFSNLLSRNIDIAPRTLEVYQMSCPEKVPFGLGKTAYNYSFLKNSNCNYCGRCYEVQEGDKKIVGKFLINGKS